MAKTLIATFLPSRKILSFQNKGVSGRREPPLLNLKAPFSFLARVPTSRGEKQHLPYKAGTTEAAEPQAGAPAKESSPGESSYCQPKTWPL